jgi:hypothetical protein
MYKRHNHNKIKFEPKDKSIILTNIILKTMLLLSIVHIKSFFLRFIYIKFNLLDVQIQNNQIIVALASAAKNLNKQ